MILQLNLFGQPIQEEKPKQVLIEEIKITRDNKPAFCESRKIGKCTHIQKSLCSNAFCVYGGREINLNN